MSDFNLAVFERKFQTDIENKFQDEMTKLRALFDVESGSGQDSLRVPVTGNHEATIDGPRFTPATPSEDEWAPVIITAKTIKWQKEIDDFDMWRTNSNLIASAQSNGIAAAMQALDNILVKALLPSANEVTLPTANKLDRDGLIKLNETLQLAYAVDPGKMNGIVSPGGNTDIISDTVIINNFHFNNDAVRKGGLTAVAGFDNIVTFNRLPDQNGNVPGPGVTMGNQRRCYFFNQNAVKLFIPHELEAKVVRDEHIDAWVVRYKMMANAAIILPEGVYYANVAN